MNNPRDYGIIAQEINELYSHEMKAPALPYESTIKVLLQKKREAKPGVEKMMFKMDLNSMFGSLSAGAKKGEVFALYGMGSGEGKSIFNDQYLLAPYYREKDAQIAYPVKRSTERNVFYCPPVSDDKREALNVYDPEHVAKQAYDRAMKVLDYL